MLTCVAEHYLSRAGGAEGVPSRGRHAGAFARSVVPLEGSDGAKDAGSDS
jgi:hypothetical protein